MKIINVSKKDLDKAMSPDFVGTLTKDKALHYPLYQVNVDGKPYGYSKACGYLTDGRMFYVSTFKGVNCLSIINKIGVTFLWSDGHREYYAKEVGKHIIYQVCGVRKGLRSSGDTAR